MGLSDVFVDRFGSFMRAHGKAMNEYRGGVNVAEIVACRRKLWAVGGNERVLTNPPRFGCSSSMFSVSFCNLQAVVLPLNGDNQTN